MPRALLLLSLLACACSGGEIDAQDDAGPPDARPDAVIPDQQQKAADMAPPVDAGSCPKFKALAGTYAGTFKGKIATLGDSTGTVSFSLLQEGADEFLTIKTGKMSGKVEGSIPYSADLQGTVTCGVMKAKIVNGKSAVAFKGEMKATHGAAGFDGTWTVTYTSGGALGSGTWKAVKK